MSNSLWPHGLQHFLVLHISRSLLKLMSISRWFHPNISSSVIPFSSCLQSFPASGSFLMSQLFTSGGQSIRTSASASVLPMNIQDWFPLGWTGLISMQSKGLSRVFSSTTVLQHSVFFMIQLGSLNYECRTLANRALGKSQHQWTKRQRFWAWFANSKVVFAPIFILYFPLSPYISQWLETFHPLNKYVLCTYWYK